MNNKLDITIGAVDCLVVMRIHYMDERFRAKEIISDDIIFTASNEFQVCSETSPALYSDSIYLWGSNNKKDNFSDTRKFNSPEEAQEYVDKVLVALKEWSTEWEGWGGNRESPNQDNRYTF